MKMDRVLPLAASLIVCVCASLEGVPRAAGPGDRPAPGRALILGSKTAPDEHPLRIAGPPLSLTSSDGAGLVLVSLQARAVVEDPLAFTELRMVFRNPEPRQIEGQFEITLPDGAAISRFAMRQPNGWQEGEIVELQAAREAYEDFLHRRQDPALLEKQAGNQFRARVFPIPPSGEKELIISYSQERPRAADPFRIYLRGLPRLGSLDLRAIVSKAEVQGGGSSLGGTTLSHQVVEVQKSNFQPDDDFVVAVPGASEGAGLRHENLVVGRVTPLGSDEPDPVDGLTVLLDTSASRALGFKDQVAQLVALVGKLREGGDKLPLRVICFDQEIETIYAGPAGGFGQKEAARILERRALGASDLGKALSVLAAGKDKALPRVLLLTDGIATAGPTEGNELRKLVQRLKDAGVRRLDALTLGGIRDEALLGRLVTAGLPRDGVVIDGELPLPVVARKLQSGTRSGIRVSVPGAAWVWPAQLDGVQPGDQVLVYADLERGKPFEVALQAGGKTDRRTVRTAEVPRPLLERAWVAARIRKLMHQRDTLAENDQDLREGLKHQVIELSTKHRVLSDFTALLILETEADYARFRIDRRGLADILTVGAGGIEVINRRSKPLIVAQPVPQWAPEESGMDQDGAAEGRPLAQGSKRPARTPPPATKAPPPPPKPSPVRADRAEKRKESAGPRSGEGQDALSARSYDSVAPGAGLRGNVSAPDSGGAAHRRAGGPSGGAPAAAPPPPTPVIAASPAPARPRVVEKIVADEKAVERRPEAPRRAPPREPAKQEEARGPATGATLRPADQARVAQGRSYQSVVSQAAGVADPTPRQRQAPGRPGTPALARDPRPLQQAQEPPPPPPYEGKLLDVMTLIKGQKRDGALKAALAWRDQEPGDVLALVALGESWESLGLKKAAARAYGSLIDLFPGRADLRRFAGERLERLGSDGLGLAIDTYDKAQAQRADHPASHRLLAFSLLRLGRPQDAFAAIERGAGRAYPSGRFAGVDRILREDAGLIAAAWLRKEPQKREAIQQRLAQLGGSLPAGPSLRFVLNWETDANDVDFHIHDGQGGHAYYSSRQLPSGGELYADVTTGYGPECFTIEGPRRAYPYRLQAHYYSRGPMGYGMGKLEIIEHDGKGGLRFAERPFVIMKDHAFVDLGQVLGPLP